jgi:acetyl-CoA carboxylase biotin carboxyl carrier protein
MLEEANDHGGRAPIDAEVLRLALNETRGLIEALEGTAVRRVSIQVGPLRIEVERGGADDPGRPIPQRHAADAAPVPGPALAPGLLPIVAPLVGVFYRAPSPGAQPFVEVGNTVEPGQTVAIVEAMKVRNEVVSDRHGVITAILVENGEAVRFEQPLMLVDTSTTGAA